MALTESKINDIKFSVDTAHGSLKAFGTPDISDSLLKHQLMHLLSAANEISKELNERQLLGTQI
jgi:hypothetical protein|tara:strand:+ start:453 stop:644 length:192 start_codon:yes stop_codon:yes gene_type:complete